MKKLIELVTGIVKEAFVKCGYDEEYGLVTLSNRPDLSEFQCNGALGAAKVYKKPPLYISTEVVKVLKQNKHFRSIY